MTAIAADALADAALRRVRAECTAIEVDAGAATGHAIHHRHEADLADMAADAAAATAHRHDADVWDARAVQLRADRIRILHAVADTPQNTAIPEPRGGAT